MVVGGSGQRGGDYSRAMEKHDDPSFDFRKGVKKATPDTVDVEAGATEDSIADFVAATKAAKENRDLPKRSLFDRLFRRN